MKKRWFNEDTSEGGGGAREEVVGRSAAQLGNSRSPTPVRNNSLVLLRRRSSKILLRGNSGILSQQHGGGSCHHWEPHITNPCSQCGASCEYCSRESRRLPEGADDVFGVYGIAQHHTPPPSPTTRTRRNSRVRSNSTSSSAPPPPRRASSGALLTLVPTIAPNFSKGNENGTTKIDLEDNDAFGNTLISLDHNEEDVPPTDHHQLATSDNNNNHKEIIKPKRRRTTTIITSPVESSSTPRGGGGEMSSSFQNLNDSSRKDTMSYEQLKADNHQYSTSILVKNDKRRATAEGGSSQQDDIRMSSTITDHNRNNNMDGGDEHETIEEEEEEEIEEEEEEEEFMETEEVEEVCCDMHLSVYEGVEMSCGNYYFSFDVVLYFLGILFIGITWLGLWTALPDHLSEPGGAILGPMSTIIVCTFVGQYIVGRNLGIPSIVGVFFTAVIWNHIYQVGFLSQGTMDVVRFVISRIGLTTILVRAGMALSWKSIKPTVFYTTALATIPLALETVTSAMLSYTLFSDTFQYDWRWCFLHGLTCSVVAAGVIAPEMLNLMSKGYVKGVAPLALSAVGPDTAIGVWAIGFVVQMIFSEDSISVIGGLGPVQLFGGVLIGATISFIFSLYLKLVRRRMWRNPIAMRRFTLACFISIACAITFFGEKFVLVGGEAIITLSFATGVGHLLQWEALKEDAVLEKRLLRNERRYAAAAAASMASAATSFGDDNDDGGGGGSSVIMMTARRTSRVHNESPLSSLPVDFLHRNSNNSNDSNNTNNHDGSQTSRQHMGGAGEDGGSTSRGANRTPSPLPMYALSARRPSLATTTTVVAAAGGGGGGLTARRRSSARSPITISSGTSPLASNYNANNNNPMSLSPFYLASFRRPSDSSGVGGGGIGTGGSMTARGPSATTSGGGGGGIIIAPTTARNIATTPWHTSRPMQLPSSRRPATARYPRGSGAGAGGSNPPPPATTTTTPAPATTSLLPSARRTHFIKIDNASEEISGGEEDGDDDDFEGSSSRRENAGDTTATTTTMDEDNNSFGNNAPFGGSSSIVGGSSAVGTGNNSESMISHVVPPPPPTSTPSFLVPRLFAPGMGDQIMLARSLPTHRGDTHRGGGSMATARSPREDPLGGTITNTNLTAILTQRDLDESTFDIYRGESTARINNPSSQLLTAAANDGLSFRDLATFRGDGTARQCRSALDAIMTSRRIADVAAVVAVAENNAANQQQRPGSPLLSSPHHHHQLHQHATMPAIHHQDSSHRLMIALPDRRHRCAGQMRSDLVVDLCDFWNFVVAGPLFSMSGTLVDLTQLFSVDFFPKGILIFGVGAIVRMIATALCSLGMGWSWKEIMFLPLVWLGKGSVQAATGGVAFETAKSLLEGLPDTASAEERANAERLVESGRIILNTASLYVLIAAPLCAILIMFLGPKMLPKPHHSLTHR